MKLTRAMRIALQAFVGATLSFGARVLADSLDSQVLAIASMIALSTCILIAGWAILFVPNVPIATDPTERKYAAAQRRTSYFFIGTLIAILIFGQTDSSTVKWLARVAIVMFFSLSVWSMFRTSRR